MAFFTTATRAANILLRPSRRLLPLARPCQRIVSSYPAVSIPVLCSFSTFRVCQQDGGFAVNDLPSFRKSPPPSRTLWVGNLPYSADEEELRSIFAPLGELLSIRMGTRFDGQARGFAHLDFPTVEEADKVLKAMQDSPVELQGRDIRVDFAPPRIRDVVPHHVLYIQQFPGDEEDLRAAFKDYEGSITRISMMRNPSTGESQGAGFVGFTNVASATTALDALKGIECAGTRLNLSYARQRPSAGQGGNARGRDGKTTFGSRVNHGGDWEIRRGKAPTRLGWRSDGGREEEGGAPVR